MWAVTSVSYSPDGQYLASGSRDKTVRLWVMPSGEPIRELKGHSDWVTSVSCSRDGQYLASGSLDRTVRLWDAQRGNTCLIISLFTTAVSTLAWGLENNLAIAEGENLSVLNLWRDNNSQWHYRLAWRTHGPLISLGLSLDQVTGLLPQYERLLKQHSGREGLKGQPADPPTIDL